MSSGRAKVIFLGSQNVGKTTLMHRIAENRFLETTEPTTATAYAEYDPPGHPEVRIQLWDTSGMEKYRAINAVYYREACAAILTFDVSDRQSFDSLDLWLGDFEKSNAMTSPAVFLAGNKCDLVDSIAVEEEIARTWADGRGLPYFSVSARTGEGMEELLDALIRSVPKFLAGKGATPTTVVLESPSSIPPEENKKCC
jgi:small GTP-binding protein